MTIPTLIYRAFQRFFQPRERVSPERRAWSSVSVQTRRQIQIVKRVTLGGHCYIFRFDNRATLLKAMLKNQWNKELDWEPRDTERVLDELEATDLAAECEMGVSGK